MATFEAQLAVLRRQLVADPGQFRELFIRDGMAALAGQFRSGELGAGFTPPALGDAAAASDDASTVLMRFLWDLPLRGSGRSSGPWTPTCATATRCSPGSRRTGRPRATSGPTSGARRRATATSGFVNTGHLGYLTQGYSQREVDLFVWLEALRDKQCADSPYELGELLASGQRKGGCPVQIHIPSLLDLLGQGKFAEALALLESCNPLPNVTGRVCPQELQCQGVCAHQQHPIEIGQLEWFLPQREKRVTPERIERRYGGRPDPWRTATKAPVAIVGSGPSRLINAFLLAAQGHPVTVFEAFHELGGVLRYGIPEFRLPNELIDDVVRDPAAGRRVRDELRRREDRDPRRSAGRRVRAGLRRDGRGPCRSS